MSASEETTSTRLPKSERKMETNLPLLADGQAALQDVEQVAERSSKMNSVLLVGLPLILRPSRDLLVEDLLRGRTELVQSDSSIRLELVDRRSFGLRSSSFSSSAPFLELLDGGSLSWSSGRVE